MLNYLWGFMILIGLGYGIVTGQVEALSNAAIDSAGEAVTLAVTMLGIMAMWTGLMEVAKQAGIMERMTRGLRPVLRFLFPRIPKGHKANEYIAANIIANDYFIIGLNKEPLTKRLYLALFFVRETALTHQQIFYIWIISSTARLSGRMLPYNKSIAEKQSP